MRLVILALVPLLTALLGHINFRALLFTLPLVLTLPPITLYSAATGRYVGIATDGPTIYASTALLLSAACYTAARMGDLSRPAAVALLWWMPLGVWLTIGLVWFWAPSPRTESAVLHLAEAAAAFALGAAVAGTPGARRVVSYSIALVVVVQTVAVVAELGGRPLRTPEGPQAADLVGRAAGLTNHPGQLAKILLLCVLCLVATNWLYQWERVFGWLVITLAMLSLAATGGRATMVAAASILLIQGLMRQRRSVSGASTSRRPALIVAAILGSAIAAPTLVRRFNTDPRGGSREHLADVAWVVIREFPLTGVGPNEYVNVAGTFDRLTASGVPVHNVFLLTWAELGLGGALCFWLPFFVVLLRSWAHRREAVGARALIAAFPGLALISLTGWGLLQSPVLELTCFSLAMLAFLSPERRTSAEANEPRGALSGGRS